MECIWLSRYLYIQMFWYSMLVIMEILSNLVLNDRTVTVHATGSVFSILLLLTLTPCGQSLCELSERTKSLAGKRAWKASLKEVNNLKRSGKFWGVYYWIICLCSQCSPSKNFQHFFSICPENFQNFLINSPISQKFLGSFSKFHQMYICILKISLRSSGFHSTFTRISWKVYVGLYGNTMVFNFIRGLDFNNS